MKLIPNSMIQVFNYSPNPVAIKGTHREYLVPAARNMGPGVEFLSADDIKYINSRSPAFKYGMLEFDETERDEIYKELGMPNWKDTILFEKDIDSMLLHPTKESLQKIINTSNLYTIERIRGHMVGLINAGEDVSSRVIKLVNERSAEVNRHPSLPSKIKLVEKDYTPPVTQDDVAKLKKELEEMKRKLSEYSSDKNEPVEDAPEETKPTKAETPKRTSSKKSTTGKTKA